MTIKDKTMDEYDEDVEDDDNDDENEGESEDEEESEEDDDDGAQQKKRKGKLQNVKIKKQKLNADDTGLNAEKNKNEKIKPPTVEELNNLRETEILFNSNLFRLQIDELLKEIEVKQKYKAKFESWFKDFKKWLEKLTPISEVNLKTLRLVKGCSRTKPNKMTQEQKALLENLPSQLQCDVDCTISFPKPKLVAIGSFYQLDAVYGKNISINVLVTIPKSIFREKDYLNNRYFVKRNVYLAYIAIQLSKSSLTSNIEYDLKNGNELLPILSLIPKNFANKVIVKLIPVLEEECFKLSRMMPNQSNARISSLVPNKEDEDCKVATPFYNSTIAHDLTYLMNENFVLENLKESQNIINGIKLLNIWLMQRGLSEGFGAFTNELLTYLLIHLKVKENLNKNMSSYQITRFVWSFLIKSDWTKMGIALTGNLNEIGAFQSTHDVVFLDKSGTCNLAADLSVEVYKKVKSEASKAITLLDTGDLNSFQLLFIMKIPFCLQYDAIVNIFNNEDDFTKMYESIGTSLRINYSDFKRPLLIKHITALFKKGLKQRAKNIVPFLDTNTKYTVGKKFNLDKITFGITLDLEFAFNVIDLGPNDNTPEVADFRDFWGDMADFRRFKDGTICWAVYFETKTVQNKRQIFRNILKYVCEEKLKLSKYNIICDQYEIVLKNKRIMCPYPSGTNEESTLKAVSIFDELSKKLRGLTLPLEVTSIQGISDVFCYTNVFPPIASIDKYKHKTQFCSVANNNLILNKDVHLEVLPTYRAPLEAVIQLSLHSKWPNNLEAIRHIKTAFFLKMSELLLKEHSIISSVKLGYLDVYYEGLVFRLYLYHPKEVAFLKKTITSDGITSYKDSEESLKLEKELNVLPKIIGALNGIHARYPSFGPSICIIKRWLRSQLIDDHLFPDVVVSLLNASLYLNANIYENSNLPQVGFYRFLKLLSETDWETEYVLVNFNDEIEKEKLLEVDTNFEQNRINFPHLHIITPYDEEKSVFTKRIVSKEVLNKLKIIATESLHLITNNINTKEVFDVKVLFTPNLTGYNVLIHIKPYANPRRFERILKEEKQANPITFEKYFKEENEIIPIIGFDPIQLYLKELRKLYGDIALFLHDTYGGNVIAVLFKPSTMEMKDFKVSQIPGRCLKNDKLALNIDAIVEDFNTLGYGIVKNIQKF